MLIEQKLTIKEIHGRLAALEVGWMSGALFDFFFFFFIMDIAKISLRIEPINRRVINKIKQRGPLVEQCEGKSLPIGLL